MITYKVPNHILKFPGYIGFNEFWEDLDFCQLCKQKMSGPYNYQYNGAYAWLFPKALPY